MSIPIPLILALLSQNMNKNTVKAVEASPEDGELVVVKKTKPRILNNISVSDNSIRKMQGVAQLLGGTRGAQIGRAANIMSSVKNINTPMNALSLLMKNNANPANIMNQNTGTGGNVSNLSSSINSMLSNMDDEKKDELMNMAQDLFSKMK